MAAVQGWPVPPPPGITPNFEHPEDVLKTVNIVAVAATIAVIAPLVAGRVTIKLCITRVFNVEDYFCVLAWALSTGYLLTGIFNSITYGPAAWATKTTLLLIFIRVFTPFRKTTRFIYVFIVLMLMYYLPVMIIKIRICNPISVLWTPGLPAVCLDRVKLFYCDTVMSALTDVVILVLPIPLVWSLKMPLNRKIQIAALLGAGGLATGASIVRLFLVFQPNDFIDETVSFIRFNLLAVAEVGIGIICTCLPAFNLLFIKHRLDRSKTASARANRSQYISSTKMSRLKVSRDLESNSEEGRSLTRVATETHVEVRSLESPREELTRVPPAAHVHLKNLATDDPRGDLILQLERVETGWKQPRS
ncbi:hypothetical protein ONS95_007532 [Cadophora gregata]|uniref:uncharacterized protein n=1 Tax=Cadophora gregata TaxID=51156 RepID=UPI0026DC7234|nr:uncharacterized protein ONS95_007532 [Cadophora gregata]KAK0118650.1 hypothetical protein ONS96_011738 [Cadophora gregata f. sp. sojae]KAK0125908.1 hypothetical protein ONS95_007532 [Cadophora gregata]